MPRNRMTDVSARRRGARASEPPFPDLIVMAVRALDGDRAGRRGEAERIVRGLIDVASRSLEESCVLAPILAKEAAGITRGAVAAALFVRDGRESLRAILPDAYPAAIVERLGHRPEDDLAGRRGGRGARGRALASPRPRSELAARMVRIALSGGVDASGETA